MPKLFIRADPCIANEFDLQRPFPYLPTQTGYPISAGTPQQVLAFFIRILNVYDKQTSSLYNQIKRYHAPKDDTRIDFDVSLFTGIIPFLITQELCSFQDRFTSFSIFFIIPLALCTCILANNKQKVNSFLKNFMNFSQWIFLPC